MEFCLLASDEVPLLRNALSVRPQRLNVSSLPKKRHGRVLQCNCKCNKRSIENPLWRFTCVSTGRFSWMHVHTYASRCLHKLSHALRSS